jgi:hypothetical protein
MYQTQRFVAVSGQKLTGRKADCPILRSLYAFTMNGAQIIKQ